jgi:alanine dehydrogenase
MIIGTVKEIKVGENRVGLTPAGVRALTEHKHRVLVEKGAGKGSGFLDQHYINAGAEMLVRPANVYRQSDMVVKVKEPQPTEFPYLQKDLILFTYLHLAAEKHLTDELLKKKVKAVAYETVELKDGSLPLLTPMSEVAGRMSVHVGAYFLQKPNGGKGQLLPSVPGTLPAKVVILGTGVVSTNAAKVAIGMGADVVMLGRNIERLRELDDIFGSTVKTRVSHLLTIEEEVRTADLIISGVCITGEKAPRLITKRTLKMMEPGTVIVDVAIDQGGSTETSKPTTHADPVFEVNGVIHYCVTNMPGAVPKTSTIALTNATLPYVMLIADNGLEDAVKQNVALMKGVNTYNGYLTYEGVAKAFGMKHENIESLL